MNKYGKEKRNAMLNLEGSKTEEGRLKIEKIERLEDKSYDYKVNIIFWTSLAALETLIRYVASDKSLTSLVPISIVPLIAFLFNKIRVDRKINNLEDEVLNSKIK